MRKLLQALLLVGLVFGGVVGTPQPAAADRCEPEELVLGAGTSPIDENDHPACVILLNYVYPFICRDTTTLLNCAFSRRLDPNYRPPLIPTYAPDPDRIYCNLYEFVVPTATCTSEREGLL